LTVARRQSRFSAATRLRLNIPILFVEGRSIVKRRALAVSSDATSGTLAEPAD
jgi:hypothetical protein